VAWCDLIGRKQRLLEAIDSFFYRYTTFVFDHPCWFLWVPVVACALMGMGLLRYNPNTDPLALYAIPNSQAIHDWDILTTTFEGWPRFAYLIVDKDPSSDRSDRTHPLVHPDTLQALADLRGKIESIRVEVDGREYGLEHVCVQDGTKLCQHESVLEFFPTGDYNRSILYPNHLALRKGSGAFVRWPVDLMVGGVTPTPDGRKVESAEAFLFRWALQDYGGHAIEAATTPVQRATVAWEKEFIAVVEEEKEKLRDERGVRVHHIARRSIVDELEKSTTLGLYDYVRYLIGGIIIFTYCMLVSCSTDIYKAKPVSAFFGCGAAVLGFLFGAGVCYALGLTHVPPTEATPFLCMGIGVDDMFVIFNSYALAAKISDPRRRVALAVKDCGISITITTLTNLISFIVGATSPYLAISNFCIVTAMSLLLGYFCVLTFFLAAVCIDAEREHCKLSFIEAYWPPARTRRRRARVAATAKTTPAQQQQQQQPPKSPYAAPSPAGKEGPSPFSPSPASTAASSLRNVASRDACRGGAESDAVDDEANLSTFELVAKQLYHQEQTIKQRRQQQQQRQEPLPQHQPPAQPPQPREGSCREAVFRPRLAYPSAYPYERGSEGTGEQKGTIGRWFRWLFRRGWGRMVTIPFVQAMVLLVMCVYWSASYWGIHEMSAGLNLLELTPFNSYYRDFWQQYFASFPSYGEDVFVVFPHQTQWWRKDVREAYMALEGRVRNGTYASDMIFSGMYEFYSRTSQETLDAMEDDPARFNRTLSRWLDRSQYQILRSDFVFDADGLQHYRFRFFARQRIPGADLVEGSRHDCKQAEQDTGGLLRCFPYADMFPYYESDISILEDTLRSLGYALIAVMIVSTFLMRHWRSWLLVMCMLVSIDVGLFGFMYHWDLQLNMITMVTLILAIGFSVDSTTHIAHTFGHAVGPTRSHRAAETLVLMGNPVFHGSFSTFLAMLIILTMDSYIFVIFFRMMTLVLSLGMCHGLLLLPVLLIFVGPFDPYVPSPLRTRIAATSTTGKGAMTLSLPATTTAAISSSNNGNVAIKVTPPGCQAGGAGPQGQVETCCETNVEESTSYDEVPSNNGGSSRESREESSNSV